MDKIRQELLEKSPLELMIRLSLPGIVGMLVLGLYSLVDAIFIGQMVGTEELGAVMVAYPFTLINNGIALLVGTGSASILSRAIGKKDYYTVDKIMGNLFMMILIFSAAVTVMGMVFTRQLVQLSGTKGEMLELTVRYLRIIYMGSFFANFAPSANMVIRAEGFIKKAMYIIASGAFANIILVPVFITIAGRKYAMEGAATATVISYITYSAVTFVYFTRKSKTVRFHHIGIDWGLVREIIPVGMSAMLMQLMNLVQQTVIYNIAGKYGSSNQIILIGTALRILTFLSIPLFGIGQGFQPIIGTNYGAGLYTRVIKIANTFLLASLLSAVFIWMMVQIAPGPVLSIFIKNSSFVSDGVPYFRQMFSFFPAVGVFIIIVTFFQALGKGNRAGGLVILRQVVISVPTAYILAYLMRMKGLWISIPVTDVLVLCIGIYLLIKEYRVLRRIDGLQEGK